MGLGWRELVLAVAEAGCAGREQLVKLALAVNRVRIVDGEPVAGKPLLPDDHYVVDWRGFWSDRVASIVDRLVRSGELARRGPCLKPVRSVLEALGDGLRSHVEEVVSVLGPLPPRQLDLEIASAVSRATGVPVLLDHVVGARVTDLIPSR